MAEITSRDNPQFRAWLKLRDSSRERRKAGLSVLDGVHLVSAFLEHVGAPEALIVSRSRADDPEIAQLIGASGMPRAHVLGDALASCLPSRRRAAFSRSWLHRAGARCPRRRDRA